MNRAQDLAIDIVIEAVNDGLTVAELEALPKELKKAVKWMKKHAFMSTRQEAKNTHPQTSPQTGIYGVSWNYEDPLNKPVRIGDAADFPDPAPASIRTGPEQARTAFCCSVFSLLKISCLFI